MYPAFSLPLPLSSSVSFLQMDCAPTKYETLGMGLLLTIHTKANPPG